MRLQENQVSDEQIHSIQQFAREISLGIEAIADDFDAKRQIVDMLGVQVALGLDEEGEKVAYASCSFQPPEELCIVSETTRCTCSCPVTGPCAAATRSRSKSMRTSARPCPT